MQDRTISNALIALYKNGGPQGELARTLLDMRGVAIPATQPRHFKRRELQMAVLSALRDGPKTGAQIYDVIHPMAPSLTRNALGSKVRHCLERLCEWGLVRREGRVWGLERRRL